MFEEGSKVLIHFPTRVKGKSEKLLHPYRGPFVIKKQVSPVTYIVAPENKPEKSETVYISRMKQFFDRTEEPQDSEAEPFMDEGILDTLSVEGDPIMKECEVRLEDIILSQSYRPSERNSTTGVNESPIRRRPGRPKKKHTTRLRSGRTTKIPDRLAYTMLMLSLIAIIDRGVAYFEPATPILWIKTPEPVINGYRRKVINMQIQNPCKYFQEKNKSTYDPQVYEWCNNKFNDKFIASLNKMCPINCK